MDVSFPPAYEALKRDTPYNCRCRQKSFPPAYEALKLVTYGLLYIHIVSFPPAYEALKPVCDFYICFMLRSFPPAYEALKLFLLGIWCRDNIVVPAYPRGIETFGPMASEYEGPVVPAHSQSI